jgi:hypothetical protein
MRIILALRPVVFRGLLGLGASGFCRSETTSRQTQAEGDDKTRTDPPCYPKQSPSYRVGSLSLSLPFFLFFFIFF